MLFLTQGRFFVIEDEILTIAEIAHYLRVSEHTVHDWAQKGEIPAEQSGSVWHFKRSEVEQWAHARPSVQTQVLESNGIALQTLIVADRIVFLNHKYKRDALVALATVIATAPQVKNRQELINEILRREELMSTAIGSGIAIPHVRLTSVTDLVVAIGISQVDIIDFQVLDNKPVRLLFMIAAAANQHSYYLQTLSLFNTRLKQSSLRQSLIKAQSPEEVYQALNQ
ncbi:MAG: PTS sugar transporter subunit IIA [Spirochaetaceae bacterium]|jgi:PTS system nitrogen regulatory IIA component|nr:PTS sugar transporter subunit IIA [Spirochaetaceae bacterium]